MEPDGSTPEVVEEIRRLQRQTRLEVRSESWRYLAVWAAVFLGAFLSAFVPGIAGWYWLAGVPLGYLGMWLAYRNLAYTGVGAKSWPYAVAGIGIGVLNGLASFLLPDEAIVFVVWVVLGGGFALLSWIDRQPLAASLFGAMSILALILGLIVDDTFELYPILALIFTFAAGGTALGLWLWARRS